jgi:biopolymer transport protein ExbD
MLTRNQFRKGKNNAPNAGSMADIAFLLLIFFLTTATIELDQGISVKLPPPLAPNTISPEIYKRNLLSVKLNFRDELLVRGEPLEIKELKEEVKAFIMNPKGLEALSEDPAFALISLENDREASYGTYIALYNELKAAYNELWDESAMRHYGKPYAALAKASQQLIRNEIPLVISERDYVPSGNRR